MPNGAFIGDSLKVSLLTYNRTLEIIFTSNQGSFEFADLPPGNYEVQVEPNGPQIDTVNQSVQVFRGAPSLITISLKEKASSKKESTNSPSISVGEIGADVPKSARKEFELASKAAQENNVDTAIIRLRKAISIYPAFVMALNDLGAQLLAQGKLEEAGDELRRAISIDGKAFNPNLNLGIVLVQQQRFAEAIEFLNRAVSLDATSPAARLYAGLAEMGLGNSDSAEKHLTAAYQIGGRSYALALFHLGQLSMNRGDRASAKKWFELYLHDVPDAVNSDQVRKLIAILR